MTFHLERRATAQPFQFTSADPYWRKAASYAQALSALHMDALNNYKGAPDSNGPRPERTMLCEMLAAAALNVQDLMIAFETRNLFSGEGSAREGMFVLGRSYPYAARHYANIVEDMRDYAVASLATPSPENIHAFGTLPALLTALAANLHAVSGLERERLASAARTFLWRLSAGSKSQEVADVTGTGSHGAE